MLWTLCFVFAIACLLASVLFALSKGKMKGKIVSPVKVLFAGVAVAVTLLSLPVYIVYCADAACGVVETIFLLIHNVVRFFLIGVDHAFLMAKVRVASAGLYSAYSVAFSVLMVVAPALTFGCVLSFFKNASAMQKYLLHFWCDAYVFSEINDRSLALAKSLRQNADTKKVLVFTSVDESKHGFTAVQMERAVELGAICFKADAVTAKLLYHSKKRAIKFFAIGEDPTKNVKLGLELVKKYGGRQNTDLYIFSTQEEAELFLLNAYGGKETKVKVRLINEVQSLILRTLYDEGHKLFANAVTGGNGKKQISVVIAGLGRHGRQMLKALPWFCQMDGYELTVHAFDVSKTAESELSANCPELLSPKYAWNETVEGEAGYSLVIHSGVNVDSAEFLQQVAAVPWVTYAFVALGNDEINIGTAVKLRSLFARLGYAGQIQAVVYDSQKCAALKEIRNFKGQEYCIEFIGDLETTYSQKVILNSDVEQAALARHLKWGREEDFWRFGYNYRSSIASAIHRKMKIYCGIPGADKLPEQRTEEERWSLRRLEHCRWNAYMRSEGYCFAEKRNDLAKQHHCLVPFDALPLAEQIKDDD